MMIRINASLSSAIYRKDDVVCVCVEIRLVSRYTSRQEQFPHFSYLIKIADDFAT
jgi:hypothetical protein